MNEDLSLMIGDYVVQASPMRHRVYESLTLITFESETQATALPSQRLGRTSPVVQASPMRHRVYESWTQSRCVRPAQDER